MAKEQPKPPADSPEAPSLQEQLDAAKLELQEVSARANMAEGQLRSRRAAPSAHALDPKSLEHPNAFLAGDGRTLYRYEMDGQQFVFPKPIEEMKEQDFYDLSLSMQDNQPGRLPQNLTVTFKDPQWAGHWFNKKAGSGARVSVARSLGFVPAKIEDLESYFGGLNDKDGAVEDNDLVLMKIHKAKLYLRCAEWMNKAKKAGGVEAYRQKASVGLTPRDSQQEPYFLTPQATGEYQGVGPVTHLPEINR
jgi:hypothetical protein